MGFVQIIELKTDKADEILKLEQEWRSATEGKRTLRQSFVTRDRNDPNRYLILAFFDSFESAQVNSDLPETQKFGQQQSALIDGPMLFTDLDIIESHT